MREHGFVNLKVILVAAVILALFAYLLHRMGGCHYFDPAGCAERIGGFKM